jgi:hypothetical protein
VRGPNRALPLLLGLVGLAIAWKLTAETIEPHLLLWLRPRAEALEVQAIGDTSLRLYGDTRPYTGKIAGLQKGLAWVKGGRLLIEEGYGFGCPIVEAGGRAYVSSSAQVQIDRHGSATRLIKRYTMDTVDTPIRFLRRKYRAVPPLGVVTFRYDVYPQGVIDVHVDLSGLEPSWDKAYLMNEQGANHFTEYWDTSGRRLQAGHIGIWEPSDVPFQRACFESPDDHLRFCVDPIDPAVAYYGRERYNQYNWRGIYYLSWSGIDLQVEGPRDIYRYRILLEAM